MVSTLRSIYHTTTVPLLRDVVYRAAHRILDIARLQNEVQTARTQLDDAIANGIFEPNARFAMTMNQTLER